MIRDINHIIAAKSPHLAATGPEIWAKAVRTWSLKLEGVAR